MGTCSQTNIPDLEVVEESCNGYYPPTRCIIHEPAITALGILAGTSLQDIITAIVSALNIQSVTINNLSLQIENQQTEIESLQAQIDACCAEIS
jgi:uncharacterized coiled-coil protein SlyX